MLLHDVYQISRGGRRGCDGGVGRGREGGREDSRLVRNTRGADNTEHDNTITRAFLSHAGRIRHHAALRKQRLF